MWKGSDMKHLFSSSSSKFTLLSYCKNLFLRPQLTPSPIPPPFSIIACVSLQGADPGANRRRVTLSTTPASPLASTLVTHTHREPAVTSQEAATECVHSVVEALREQHNNILPLVSFHLHYCNLCSTIVL